MSNKTTISVRATKQQSEAVDRIASEYNVSKSELLRGQIRRLIDEHEKIIDPYMALSNEIEKQQTKSNPYQRVSHMPNNLHESLRHQIDEPYPIPPDEVNEEYYRPYAKAIKAKYPDDEEKQKRAMSKLDHAMRMYEVLHPTNDPPGNEVVRACVHYARGIMEEEDMETARAWVKRRIDDGILPDERRDEVFDKLRETRREEWQEDWKQGVRANWGET